MIRELGSTSKWIDSKRRCVCSIMIGSPEPDCEIHGIDACYGRFASIWWGRIRIPVRRHRTVRPAA